MTSFDGADDPANTLRYLDSVASLTRSQQTLFWFPMLLFGAISLVAAPVAGLYGELALGLYWIGAGTLGSILTASFYRKRKRSMGLRRSEPAYVVLVVLLLLGLFIGSAVLAGDPAWFLCTWLGLLYLGFASLERSPTIAGAAVVLIAVGLALFVIKPDNPSVWSSVLTGLALMIGGLATYRVYRRS